MGAMLKTADRKVISGQEAYDKGLDIKEDLQGQAQAGEGQVGDLQSQAQG